MMRESMKVPLKVVKKLLKVVHNISVAQKGVSLNVNPIILMATLKLYSTNKISGVAGILSAIAILCALMPVSRR